MNVLVLIANDFEDLEIRKPLESLFEEGYSADLAGPEARQLYFGRRHRETLMSDVAFHHVRRMSVTTPPPWLSCATSGPGRSPSQPLAKASACWSESHANT
jgi:hypothetical protein